MIETRCTKESIEAYAGKFFADEWNPYNPDDMSDEGLTSVFSGCVMPPPPEWYPVIREAILARVREVQSKEITDVQQARTIINAVGEVYQREVIDLLRSAASSGPESTDSEMKAHEIISNMEYGYALSVANVLWAIKFDQIPGYIKNY